MSKTGSYHRGNLRADLLMNARIMIEEDGSDSISIRKLAAKVGVSHNAPYMHFKDRDRLLAAIAEDGFRSMIAAIAQSTEDTSLVWTERFAEGCRAYIEFAAAQPSLYKTMFREFGPIVDPDAVDMSLQAFAWLKDLMVQGESTGTLPAGDAQARAAFVWTALHGISDIVGSRQNAPQVFEELEGSIRETVIAFLGRAIGIDHGKQKTACTD